jgi:hypothetical protein
VRKEYAMRPVEVGYKDTGLTLIHKMSLLEQNVVNATQNNPRGTTPWSICQHVALYLAADTLRAWQRHSEEKVVPRIMRLADVAHHTQALPPACVAPATAVAFRAVRHELLHLDPQEVRGILQRMRMGRPSPGCPGITADEPLFAFMARFEPVASELHRETAAGVKTYADAFANALPNALQAHWLTQYSSDVCALCQGKSPVPFFDFLVKHRGALHAFWLQLRATQEQARVAAPPTVRPAMPRAG